MSDNQPHPHPRASDVAARAAVVAAAHELEKTYDEGRIRVLRKVSLTVHAGELVALWGASGSGKSTLLHLLGGLDVPDAGDLWVCGLDPRREHDRLTLRRQHLGFVFQLHHLIPDLTVEENINVPALARGMCPVEARQRLLTLTRSVGIGHRLTHRIQDLSGGERQRTALCRAMMNRPQLLLADEPTGSLDEETGNAVFGLLRELVQREGLAVVLATHERRFADQCHRVLWMRDGTLTEV